MKILKETLLFNDLKSTLDSINEVTLIMRSDKEVVVAMTLEEYNKMKEKMYKKD